MITIKIHWNSKIKRRLSDKYNEILRHILEGDGWKCLPESYDLVTDKFPGEMLYWPHTNHKTLKRFGYSDWRLPTIAFIAGWEIE